MGYPLPHLLPRLEPEEIAPAQPGPSSVEPRTEPEAEAKAEGDGEAVLIEEDLIQQSLDDYDAGKYSPRLLTSHELPFDAHVVDADEDLQRLQLSRQQLQVTGEEWEDGGRLHLGFMMAVCVCNAANGAVPQKEFMFWNAKKKGEE